MNNSKDGEEAAAASLISQYHALFPAQKAMLQLLAVNVDYCSLNLLSRCLNELGVADQRGRRFTPVGFRPLAGRTAGKGSAAERRQRGLLSGTRFGSTHSMIR